MIHKLKIFIQATDQSIHGLESYLQAFVPHMLKHFVHYDKKIVQTLQSEIVDSESDIVAALVHCGRPYIALVVSSLLGLPPIRI